MTAARRAPAFTLIEVMFAIAILTVLTATCWLTVSRALHARDEYEKVQERYRTVRVAMERMVKDLSMAYLSLNDNPLSPDKRTYFIGKQAQDGDMLRFSTFGHTPRVADAHESDECAVQYWVGADPDDPGKQVLLRRETRRLADLPFEKIPGETYVVTDDVVSLEVSFWDARDKVWREEWDTTSADGEPAREPGRVKIVLTVNDEKGDPVSFLTQAAIPMQEPEIGSQVAAPAGAVQ